MREILTQNNGEYYKEHNKYVFDMWETATRDTFENLSSINKYAIELVFEF